MELHAGGTDRFLLAVSGGSDSMGLLAMLVLDLQILPSRLTACYVDHGIRPDVTEDRRAIRRFTEKHGISFKTVKVNVPAEVQSRRMSVEAAARKLRYRALEQIAGEEDCRWILTGHTLDDSAETVLMRILSGAPWYECTGIPARRGKILRPLNGVYRDELRAWMGSAGIDHAEDETNTDPRFERNRLRQRLSGLGSYWTRQKIRDLAEAGSDIQSRINGLRRIALKLTDCGSKQVFTDRFELAIPRILAYFIKLEFLPVEVAYGNLIGAPDRRLPSSLRRQIRECIRGNAESSEVTLPDDVTMLRRGNRIWVHRGKRIEIKQSLQLGENRVPEANLIVELTLTENARTDSDHEHRLDGECSRQTLILRNWRPGDRIKPRGRRIRKISDYLADEKLDPVERARTLVVADDTGPLLILRRTVAARALPRSGCREYLKVSWKAIDD